MLKHRNSLRPSLALTSAIILMVNVSDAFSALQGGDICEDATVISSIPYTDVGTTAGYTDDYDEVCPFTGSTSPDVVYLYTAIGDECVSIDLCDSDYDTKIYVYEDICQEPNDGQEPYACSDDDCGVQSQIIGLHLHGGHDYFIVIDGYGGYSGDYVLTVNVDLCAFGACCVEGECIGTMFEEECTALGGSWYGDEDCETFTCPGSPEIPTLSEWGMLILALLLLAVGTVAVMRMRKAATSKAV